jgi:hypothetical protein
MAKDNQVPKVEVDRALFKNSSASIKALQAQARKELRNKARASWKAKQGLANIKP